MQLQQRLWVGSMEIWSWAGLSIRDASNWGKVTLPPALPGIGLGCGEGLPAQGKQLFLASCCCCSVTQSCLTLCDPMDGSMPGFPVLHHLPQLAQTHIYWVSDTIQPSHPLSSPSSVFNLSQLMSWLFTSDGKSIGSSASVLPINIQGWFHLGLTGLISLLSKGLSRVFSSTIVRRHQFFCTQPFLFSNSHIHTWLLEKL